MEIKLKETISVGDFIVLSNEKVYMIIRSMDKDGMRTFKYRLLNISNGHTMELEEWNSIEDLKKFIERELNVIRIISNSSMKLEEK